MRCTPGISLNSRCTYIKQNVKSKRRTVVHSAFRNACKSYFKETLHFKNKNISFCILDAFLILGQLKL